MKATFFGPFRRADSIKVQMPKSGLFVYVNRMAIVKWEPFSDLDRFFGDVDSLFPTRTAQGADLSVDLYEEGNSVIAEMSLPGIDPEKVDITVQDTHLRIAGAREEKQETNEKQFYRKEIRRGSFERIVRLPVAVDRKNVEAQYSKGVLQVVMPKLAQQASEKVKINITS